MDEGLVLYRTEGKVAYITLNRPESLNAMNRAMFQATGEAWNRFNDDEDAWVAIVTGAGRAMCVGVDVKAASSGDYRMPRKSWEDEARKRKFFTRCGPYPFRVAKPTIAAINGFCCGAGLDFATECDIVICAADAQFWDPHVSVGLVSGHELIQVARRVSVSLALQMGMMGNKFRLDAQKALSAGLVSEVVPREQLLARATEIAEAVLAQSPLAVLGTKRCILNSMQLSLDAAVEMSEYIRRDVIDTEDFAEGPKAFGEKRPAQWQRK